MKLKAATQRSRRCKLDRDLFAFLGDPVTVVGQVGGIQFHIKPARFCFPHVESGAKVRGEMLVQTGAVFHDSPAAITQSGSHPGASPAIAIKEIGGPGVRLIKSWLDALTRIERFVAGEAAAYRAIEVSAGNGILQPRAHAQLFQASHIQDHISAAGTRCAEVDGRNSREMLISWFSKLLCPL